MSLTVRLQGCAQVSKFPEELWTNQKAAKGERVATLAMVPLAEELVDPLNEDDEVALVAKCLSGKIPLDAIKYLSSRLRDVLLADERVHFILACHGAWEKVPLTKYLSPTFAEEVGFVLRAVKESAGAFRGLPSDSPMLNERAICIAGLESISREYAANLAAGICQTDRDIQIYGTKDARTSILRRYNHPELRMRRGLPEYTIEAFKNDPVVLLLYTGVGLSEQYKPTIVAKAVLNALGVTKGAKVPANCKHPVVIPPIDMQNLVLLEELADAATIATRVCDPSDRTYSCTTPYKLFEEIVKTVEKPGGPLEESRKRKHEDGGYA